MIITIKALDATSAEHMIRQIAPLDYQKVDGGGLNRAGYGVEYFRGGNIGLAKIYERHQLAQVSVFSESSNATVNICTNFNSICGEPTIAETDSLTASQIAEICAALNQPAVFAQKGKKSNGYSTIR